MGEGITAIIVATIQAFATIVAGCLVAFITAAGYILIARMNKTTKTITGAQKSIEEISEILPSTRLLYELDKSGKCIAGSIKQLIEAVEKGYPIKIRVHQPNGITRLFDAQLLLVENDIVYAVNTNEISLQKDEQGIYEFQKNPYHYFVVVSSQGNYNVLRVYLDGKTGNPSKNQWAMAWIGLVPPNEESKLHYLREEHPK